MAFRFKQFVVEDRGASMKVGTDAVILGAWGTTHQPPTTALDIGTGSGLIALMMAQRFEEARITAIDIHEESCLRAAENFKNSKWNDRLQVMNISLQDLCSRAELKYDLIISNPPFFSHSLLPPDKNKIIAKHNRELSFKEMAGCVSMLLEKDGCFNLILPVNAMPAFEKEALISGLHKSKELIITPIAGKSPNRVISSWSFSKAALQTEHITIRKDTKHYSEEYINLTNDFYLAL